MKRPLLSIGLLALLALACSKAEETPKPDPTYTLFPKEGLRRSYAMLKTNVLASTVDGNTLKLGEHTVSVLEKRNDTLIFQIPGGISLGDYPVKLTANGETYNLGTYSIKFLASTTFAGSYGDGGLINGALTEARFRNPSGLYLVNNNLYCVERGNHTLRKIDFSTSRVSTIAGNGGSGNSTQASQNCFANPDFLIVDATNNFFVSNYSYNQVSRMANGATTLSEEADITRPTGMTKAANGDLLVMESESGIIYRITPSGAKTVFAGANATTASSGPKENVRFLGGTGIHNMGGDTILVCDAGRNQIRIIEGNNVRVLAGSGAFGSNDGKASTATFEYPTQITSAANGLIFMTDQNAGTVRILYPFGYIFTFSSGGNPAGIACSRDGKTIYYSESSAHTILKYYIE